jgi:hypothetical protein
VIFKRSEGNGGALGDNSFLRLAGLFGHDLFPARSLSGTISFRHDLFLSANNNFFHLHLALTSSSPEQPSILHHRLSVPPKKRKASGTRRTSSSAENFSRAELFRDRIGHLDEGLVLANERVRKSIARISLGATR